MPREEELYLEFRNQADRFEIHWTLPWYGGPATERLWNHQLLRLTLLAPTEIFTGITTRLLDDTSFALRGLACHLAQARKSTHHVAKLRYLLKQDDSVPVRALAVWAVAHLAPLNDVMDDLAALHDGEHLEVKRAALRAFAGSRDDRAIPVAARWLLGASQDETVKVQAAQVLGLFNSDLAVQALAEELDQMSEPDAPRAESARSLGLCGNSRAIEALRRHVNSDRPWVRAAVLLALSAADPEAGDELYAAAVLSTEPWMVRSAGIEALGRRRTQSGFDMITRLLRDPEARVRAEACAAAGERGDRRILPLLAENLDDKDFAVQIQATNAAGRLLGVDFGLSSEIGKPMLDMKAVRSAIAAARKKILEAKG